MVWQQPNLRMQRSARSEIVPFPLTPLRAPADAGVRRHRGRPLHSRQVHIPCSVTSLSFPADSEQGGLRPSPLVSFVFQGSPLQSAVLICSPCPRSHIAASPRDCTWPPVGVNRLRLSSVRPFPRVSGRPSRGLALSPFVSRPLPAAPQIDGVELSHAAERAQRGRSFTLDAVARAR